jgi:hypothetical protein
MLVHFYYNNEEGIKKKTMTDKLTWIILGGIGILVFTTMKNNPMTRSVPIKTMTQHKLDAHEIVIHTPELQKLDAITRNVEKHLTMTTHKMNTNESITVPGFPDIKIPHHRNLPTPIWGRRTKRRGRWGGNF